MSRRIQSAGSATALLMGSALASGVLALVRVKYVNFLFGAGVAQDAYRVAFRLPDLVSYFLVGSAASVSLITMLNRYREAGATPDDEAADRALSVVLTTMLLVLSVAVLVAMVLTPLYVRLQAPDFFNDARGALCVQLTRLLLVPQLFFFVGSMMSARLQVRKIFVYQAFTPVLYNSCIVLGAFFLHRQLGIASLVVGVYAGTILGSAAVNTFGAVRTGLRFRPVVDFRHPAFLEWFRAALPLMLGVSVVMFDSYFLSRFASARVGGVTLMSNAKDLFNAPFNVIGPAAGAASLPFFASLFQRGQREDFSRSVARSVTRLFSLGMLVTAWMIAVAPWLMDLFRGGRFNREDAAVMTRLFMIFALTLAVWAVQGIYARAFYAASDTRTPAIAGTAMVVLTLPFYWLLSRRFGLPGLAVASDLAIVAQTATLAVLLARRRLVLFRDLEGGELARSLLAAVAAGAAGFYATRAMPAATGHGGDFAVMAVGSAAWLVVAAGVLVATRSALPRQVLRR